MRTCPICQKEFEPNQKQRKYCGPECSRAGYAQQKHRYKNPAFRDCANCGKPFVLDKPDRKYCSRKCYGMANIGHTHTPQKRITVACVVCGTEFETGGRAGKKDKQYCSRNCRNLARYRQGAKANQLSNVDAAYIAGLFDGEGSVICHLNREIAQIRITITNTNKEIIEWMRESTGIGTITYKCGIRQEHKDVWTWTCNSEAAFAILQQIRPYLRIKARQAALASSVQERLRIPMQKADRAWQNEVCEQMRLLNRRGPSEQMKEDTD